MRILIKVILLFIIAGVIYFIIPRNTDKLIYVPKNNFNAIESFKLQNIPLNQLDYYLLSYLNIESGWIRLNKNIITKWELYNTILNSPREKTRIMVMFGGETIYNFIEKISKQAKLNKNKLINIYKSLAIYPEGEIVARKYNIPFNTTEHSTLAYMIYKSHTIYKKLAKKYNIKFPSNEFKKRLIIASIIEKETQYYKEMPLISAVIHNRLKQNMPLQIDATLNYGKNTHKIITPQMIKTDNSLYNTYKHKGLPPEPIASPSIAALNAAFNPSKVDYLYFVKNGNKHTFSKNYKKHIKGVSKYKQSLKIKKAREKRLTRLINKPIKVKFPIIKPKINIPIPQIGYNFNKKKS